MKRVLKKATSKLALNQNSKADHLWEIIKIPIFVMGLYSILTSFLPLDISNSKIFPLWLVSLLISLFSFGYIGYKAIKLKQETKFALKAGAYAGAIVGFIGAVLGLILIYFFPDRFAQTIYEISKSTNIDASLIKSLLVLISWINLVTGPVFNGLFGALLSWLSALIFKKK